MGLLERPMVSFPQQFPKEARRLRPIQSHEERSQVLAHEPSDGAVRPEVDAVVFQALPLSIDTDRVVLHPPGKQGVCLLVDRDQRGVDRFRGGQPIRPEEDEEQFLEAHLVDVLVQRDVGLDRPRFVLDFPIADFHCDPGPLEASLIFLSMYACSSGVYLTRFRGSLKYRRAARAWKGVCKGYFQFAGSAYLSGSFGYPCGGPRRPSLLRLGFTARGIEGR